MGRNEDEMQPEDNYPGRSRAHYMMRMETLWSWLTLSMLRYLKEFGRD